MSSTDPYRGHLSGSCHSYSYTLRVEEDKVRKFVAPTNQSCIYLESRCATAQECSLPYLHAAVRQPRFRTESRSTSTRGLFQDSQIRTYGFLHSRCSKRLFPVTAHVYDFYLCTHYLSLSLSHRSSHSRGDPSGCSLHGTPRSFSMSIGRGRSRRVYIHTEPLCTGPHTRVYVRMCPRRPAREAVVDRRNDLLRSRLIAEMPFAPYSHVVPGDAADDRSFIEKTSPDTTAFFKRGGSPLLPSFPLS